MSRVISIFHTVLSLALIVSCLIWTPVQAIGVKYDYDTRLNVSFSGEEAERTGGATYAYDYSCNLPYTTLASDLVYADGYDYDAYPNFVSQTENTEYEHLYGY